MRYLYAVSIVIFYTGVLAQDLTTKSKKAIELYQEADNYRVRRQYNMAIDLLYQAIKKDKNFAEAYFRLGLIYKAQGNKELSMEYFQQSHQLFPVDKKYPMVYFEMAELYMDQEDYQQAEQQINQFLETKPRDNMTIMMAKKIQIDALYGQKNKSKAVEISPVPLSNIVNAFPIQYFPVVTADRKSLIFTARGPNTDEELVLCTRTSVEEEWSPPRSISRNINSRANEGTCTVSGDGNTLIFTSCQGRPGFGSCDLYVSYKIGDEWQIPQNMGPEINSADWDSQPSLSADGQTLYFVSNRHGGIGSRDIWVTTRDEQGRWAVPKNMGEGINTPFNEISPFIHANSKTLYFASDGYPGFGGFDIYFVEKKNNKWTFPENYGYPVNNSSGQMSLFINADGKKAYYSQEKDVDGGFYSRLMQFDVPEEIQVAYKTNYVTGIITDADTGLPLRSTIELFDVNNNEKISRVNSDSVSGRYLMVLTEGSEYALYVNKKGYLFENLSFNFNDTLQEEPLYYDIKLKKAEKGASVVLNNIFFDIGSYSLRDKSVTELERIVKFLHENEAIVIEISGHTDNIGSKNENKVLSENRAKSVYQYLVDKKIDQRRISFMGYGDSKPAVPNDTETNRQKNRRIEFNIK